MLKRTIKYTDLNGDEQEDIFYFNLSKPEVIELQVGVEGGFGQMLQNIVESKNNKEIVARFKQIIQMAYGEKSEDGKRFIKSEELSKKFSETPAYEVLYMQLLQDENFAAEFMNGLLPQNMLAELVKDQDKPKPPVPTNPV